jgi:hypothetical protein
MLPEQPDEVVRAVLTWIGGLPRSGA